MHPKPRETKLSAKKNRILDLIFREEGCSRFRLARELNINASMVGIYVKEFLDRGVLREEHTGPTRRGRSPIPVRLNPMHGCFLGLDFEALRARAVVTDFAGGVITRKEIAFPPGIPRQAVLGRLVVLGKDLTKEIADRPLLAVGIACPGLVDSAEGKILNYSLLDDFRDVAILDLFEPQFPAPVFIEHSVRAITLAEQIRGAGRGLSNFLCLSVRSGMDLGISMDGRIHTGQGSLAGKVGYNVFPHGDSTKTWTDLVSATGIIHEVIQILKSLRKNELRSGLLKRGESLSLANIVEAAEQGDKSLREHLERVGSHLGIILANLANIFAPELIILAGEVPTCSPLVREKLEATFRQTVLNELLDQVVLADSQLGHYAGSIGAAYRGFLQIFPTEEQMSL